MKTVPIIATEKSAKKVFGAQEKKKGGMQAKTAR